MKEHSTTTLIRCGVVAVVLAALVAPTAAQDKSWGDLLGRVVVKGKAPPRKEIKITKDNDYFKKPIFDDSLLVNPKTKGLANVLVYLVPKKGEELKSRPVGAVSLIKARMIDITIPNMAQETLAKRTTIDPKTGAKTVTVHPAISLSMNIKAADGTAIEETIHATINSLPN